MMYTQYIFQKHGKNLTFVKSALTDQMCHIFFYPVLLFFLHYSPLGIVLFKGFEI